MSMRSESIELRVISDRNLPECNFAYFTVGPR